MANEAQSRYGIMEKLNQQKIDAREKLAKMENQLDADTYKQDNEILEIENLIKDRKTNYKYEHVMWKREKEVNLKQIKQDNKRTEEELTQEINNRDKNYEQNFSDWLKNAEGTLVGKKGAVTRLKSEQSAKIKTQKEIIEQIESGIKDLKDMSAEQKEK